MTTATRNEAAERLRAHLTEDHGGCAWAEEGRDGDWIELALAAERRATVERIRERLRAITLPSMGGMLHHAQANHVMDRVHAILDEEAAR